VETGQGNLPAREIPCATPVFRDYLAEPPAWEKLMRKAGIEKLFGGRVVAAGLYFLAS